MLSGRCNLSCAYCYQNARTARARLPWDAARAALDLLLERGTPPLLVEFSGGEPLLEPDLLARCVEYVEARRPPDAGVQYVLTTNGTLLSADVLSFLDRHRVVLQLSFDGLPSVQKLRGRGTFQRLDSALDALLADHTAYAVRLLRVQSVFTPETLGHMAESARYFMAKNVPAVALQPALGMEGGWGEAERRVLEEQVSQIVEDGVRHWQIRHAVPVLFLLGPNPEAGRGPGGGFICGAGVGKGLCVDSGGHAWTCPLFASSLQDLPACSKAVSDAVDLGDARAPELWERLTETRQRTRGLRELTRRRDKYSSYGACRHCEFLEECFVCPAAATHLPGDADPDRVPDFHCAYSLATARARRQFRTMLAGTRH